MKRSPGSQYTRIHVSSSCTTLIGIQFFLYPIKPSITRSVNKLRRDERVRGYGRSEGRRGNSVPSIIFSSHRNTENKKDERSSRPLECQSTPLPRALAGPPHARSSQRRRGGSAGKWVTRFFWAGKLVEVVLTLRKKLAVVASSTMKTSSRLNSRSSFSVVTRFETATLSERFTWVGSFWFPIECRSPRKTNEGSFGSCEHFLRSVTGVSSARNVCLSWMSESSGPNLPNLHTCALLHLIYGDEPARGGLMIISRFLANMPELSSCPSNVSLRKVPSNSHRRVDVVRQATVSVRVRVLLPDEHHLRQTEKWSARELH